jgi:hypothetical protein
MFVAPVEEQREAPHRVALTVAHLTLADLQEATLRVGVSGSCQRAEWCQHFVEPTTSQARSTLPEQPFGGGVAVHDASSMACHHHSIVELVHHGAVRKRHTLEELVAEGRDVEDPHGEDETAGRQVEAKRHQLRDVEDARGHGNECRAGHQEAARTMCPPRGAEMQKGTHQRRRIGPGDGDPKNRPREYRGARLQRGEAHVANEESVPLVGDQAQVHERRGGTQHGDRRGAPREGRSGHGARQHQPAQGSDQHAQVEELQ